MTRKDLKSLRSFIGYQETYLQHTMTAAQLKECKRLIRVLNKELRT